MSLNNAVEKNKTLVELSLLHTGISLATKTQRSLVLNNNLMHNDLSCNDLGANGAKSIIKHLKKNPPLSMLSLECKRSLQRAEAQYKSRPFRPTKQFLTLTVAVAFNSSDFQNVPLELMPRLLELVQQELGYGRYGREVWKAPIRAKGSNPCLTRVYEVVHGWTMLPSLFARGPGKLKKKSKKKRKHAYAFKDDDDQEWTPNNRY
eukprot:scaffold4087_cov153-Skeletonema_marinoi.AAC.2